MNQDSVNKVVLVLIVTSVSALFFSMISQFVMAIFLAGLFSAFARPVYRRLNILFKGRRHAASLTTLFMMIVVVLIPLLILGGLVVGQAIDVVVHIRRRSESRRIDEIVAVEGYRDGAYVTRDLSPAAEVIQLTPSPNQERITS